MRFRDYDPLEKMFIVLGWSFIVFLITTGLLIVSVAFSILCSAPTRSTPTCEMKGLIAPGVPRTDYEQKGGNDGR